MASPQNINTASLDRNTSANYFNNFYINYPTVSGNQNDAIIAYFVNYTGSQTAGENLASAVIATSIAQRIDPMLTLQHFTQVPRNQLSTFLATFLNLNRVGTSYLGVRNAPVTNKYLQRSILP